MELRNASGLQFTDISSEELRSYRSNGTTFHVIENPLFLNVSASGGHRVLDSQGLCHYIKPSEGWALTWKVRDGEPHFVK